jgi:hypothetical protein
MAEKNWDDNDITNGDTISTTEWMEMADVISAKLDSSDAFTELSEDTSPQLGGNLDLNSNGLILASQVVGSGASTNNLVYWDGDSWEQADADQSTTCDGILGINLGSSSILIDGVFTTTGLTAGDTYYVSTTDGAITNTAPSSTGDIVRSIGMALSTTQLLFKPSQTYLEVA